MFREQVCEPLYSRDFVHGANNRCQELVCHCPHVSDGGIQACPHLLMTQGLLGGHIVWQLTVGDTRSRWPWALPCCCLSGSSPLSFPMQFWSAGLLKNHVLVFYPSLPYSESPGISFGILSVPSPGHCEKRPNSFHTTTHTLVAWMQTEQEERLVKMLMWPGPRAEAGTLWTSTIYFQWRTLITKQASLLYRNWIF